MMIVMTRRMRRRRRRPGGRPKLLLWQTPQASRHALIYCYGQQPQEEVAEDIATCQKRVDELSGFTKTVLTEVCGALASGTL